MKDLKGVLFDALTRNAEHLNSPTLIGTDSSLGAWYVLVIAEEKVDTELERERWKGIEGEKEKER